MQTKSFSVVGVLALISTAVAIACFYIASYYEKATPKMELDETVWGMCGVLAFFVSLILTACACLLWFLKDKTKK